jgi:S1-C subfamily serine protease
MKFEYKTVSDRSPSILTPSLSQRTFMSSKISMWVGLLGVAATIPLVQTVTVAKTSVAVAEIAKTVTVSITTPNIQGSGVTIQHQGDVYTVLTTAHGVKKKVDYKITAPDDRVYEAIGNSIQSAPGDIDLAVIKFRAKANYSIAKLGNCNLIKTGMDVYVTGFPGKDRAIVSPILAVVQGKVIANSSKPQSHGYSLIYDNNTVNGMGGGAVFNSDGELIAIHGLADRDDDGRRNGFNLGIPIERFGTVASQMGVELNSR